MQALPRFAISFFAAAAVAVVAYAGPEAIPDSKEVAPPHLQLVSGAGFYLSARLGAVSGSATAKTRI